MASAAAAAAAGVGLAATLPLLASKCSSPHTNTLLVGRRVISTHVFYVYLTFAAANVALMSYTPSYPSGDRPMNELRGRLETELSLENTSGSANGLFSFVVVARRPN